MITTRQADLLPPKALSARAAEAPERELRLMVEGIREWLSRLGQEGSSPGSVGILEGQGQGEVLGALSQVCRELGMNVLHGQCHGFSGWPPGAMGTIAEQLLQVLLEREPSAGPPDKPAPAVLDEISRLVPGGGGSPPPTLGLELDTSRSVDALCRTILQLSGRKPTLLIVEEVPRADSFTSSVLRQVLRMLHLRHERQRVLVIASASVPGTLDAALAGVGVPLKQIEAFRVQGRGYSREDLRHVSQSILGEEIPVSLREKVFRATGGGVRHIRWLLWHFKETSGIDWKLDGFSEAEATFRQIVEARYSRLDDDQKEMVQILSALDAPCPPSLLSPGTSSSFETAVGRLQDRGWLVHQPCLRIEGEVAQVVLSKMGETSRRKLHERLGGILVEVGRRDWRWLPCALHHQRLSRSGRAGLDLLHECLAHMEKLGSSSEALLMLEDFLGSAPALHPHEDRDLLVKKAELLAGLGQDSRAIEVYRGLVAGEKDPEREALLRRRMGDLHGQQLRREEQVEEYTRGLQALGEESPSPERPALMAVLSRVHLEIEQVEESREYFRKCAESLESIGASQPTHVEEIHHLVEYILRPGARQRGLALLEERFLDLCEKAGGIRGKVSWLLGTARLQGLRGGFAKAEACLSEALRDAHDSGSRWLTSRVLEAWGCIAGECGEPEKALRCLEEARQIFAELGKEADARQVSREMAGTELELMQVGPASRELLALAAAWPRGETSTVKSRLLRPWGLEARARALQVHNLEKASKGTGPQSVEKRFLLAQMMEGEGRLSDALKLYQDCLQAEAAHLKAKIRPLVFLGMGRIAALRGDEEGALRFFEQSLAMQGEGPQRDVVLEVHLEVSGVFLTRGEYRRTFDHAVRGLKQALEVEDLEGTTHALVRLAAFLDEVGFKTHAADVATAARSLASAGDLPIWELVACEQLARLSWTTSGDRPGLDGMERAQWLCDQLKLPIEECRLKLEQAWRDHRAKRFADGLLRAREGIEIARAIGVPPLLEEFLHVVGVIESSAANPRKNFLRALDVLEQARQGAEARNHPRLCWEVLHAMSNIYRERGKKDLSAELSLAATEIELQVFTACPKELQGAGWSLRYPPC